MLQVTNADGVWVKLDAESIEEYCDIADSDAWTLCMSKDHTYYLQHESDLGLGGRDPFSFSTLPSTSNRGFDFSSAHHQSTVFPSFGEKNEGL